MLGCTGRSQREREWWGSSQDCRTVMYKGTDVRLMGTKCPENPGSEQIHAIRNSIVLL